MRQVLSIVCYCVAGFFVYTAGLLAFVSGLSPLAKWALVVGFSVPGLLSMLVGLAIGRFRSWWRKIGIVLLAGTAVNALVASTLICVSLSEEYRCMFPRNELAYFSDYLTGFVFMLVVAAVGGALLRKRQVSS